SIDSNAGGRTRGLAVPDGDADAMVVASASAGGEPSSRFVILRGFDRRGFVFFTNYDSPKARDKGGASRRDRGKCVGVRLGHGWALAKVRGARPVRSGPPSTRARVSGRGGSRTRSSRAPPRDRPPVAAQPDGEDSGRDDRQRTAGRFRGARLLERQGQGERRPPCEPCGPILCPVCAVDSVLKPARSPAIQ